MIAKKLTYIALLISFITNAQQPTAVETLAKVETYYKTAKALNINVEYAMYMGHTGTYLTELYKGNIYKNNAVTQLKVLGSEVLQFSDVQITINNEDKTLIYNVSSNNGLSKSPLDTSAFLNFYREVSTQVSGNTIIHELVLKNRQIPIPYNKIVIHLNKNDYSLKKQILYLSKKMPFVNKEGENIEDVGRMEITFQSNPVTHIKAPELQDYVVLEANKKPRLSKAYTSYTIIDQTNL